MVVLAVRCAMAMMVLIALPLGPCSAEATPTPNASMPIRSESTIVSDRDKALLDRSGDRALIPVFSGNFNKGPAPDLLPTTTVALAIITGGLLVQAGLVFDVPGAFSPATIAASCSVSWAPDEENGAQPCRPTMATAAHYQFGAGLRPTEVRSSITVTDDLAALVVVLEPGMLAVLATAGIGLAWGLSRR